jgi:hypothetical protein
MVGKGEVKCGKRVKGEGTVEDGEKKVKVRVGNVEGLRVGKGGRVEGRKKGNGCGLEKGEGKCSLNPFPLSHP